MRPDPGGSWAKYHQKFCHRAAELHVSLMSGMCLMRRTPRFFDSLISELAISRPMRHEASLLSAMRRWLAMNSSQPTYPGWAAFRQTAQSAIARGS